jgi:RNA polymerase sigma factor (sigma-70 family)
MFILALWPWPQKASCDDLFGLVRRYQATSDQQLIVQLLECVEGETLRLSMIFARRIPTAELRQDFLQVFFTKVCEKLLSYDITSNVTGLILTMAKHEAINFSQKVNRETLRTVSLSDPEGGSAQSFAGGPPSAEHQMNLRQFMAEAQVLLGEEKWAAIDKVYLQGMSRQEAAEALGMSSTRLRGVLERAVLKLRAQFADRFWDYFGQD